MNKLIILLLNLLLHIATGNPENSPSAPALYVFGDSLFDSGNNNFLPTLAKANYAPYGIDFHGGPTGRFTNGKTTADFIAEFLGLPYSPPYLRSRRLEQLKGLNFASGSCGILPETGVLLGKCLSLGEQVGLFGKIVEEELPKKYQNSIGLSNYLSKSIFLISIGSNDYLINYLLRQQFNMSKRYTPQSFAKLLISHLSQQLQRLYQLGARKVITFGIGPIGCIPSITRQYKHSGHCVEKVNQLVLIFNGELQPMLHNLTSTLQGSAFILGQAYPLAHDAVLNPSKYGMRDSSNPCCVTWFNGTSPCIPELGELACRQPAKHYFWDGYHLTETVYRAIAYGCFNSSSVCIPRNIKELVSQA